MQKPHDYDKILTRLTIILQRLYEGEILNISELAEEFNVSTKTIQRDFNERLIRFPIEKQGRNWKMQEGCSLQKNRSAEENLILDMIEEISEGIGHAFGTKAKSLLSKLKNSDENPIYSKIAIEDLSDKTVIFSEIQKAINERLFINFAYKSKRREIKPYKIVSFEGYWYLYGQDCKDAKLKTYYFKEINNLKVENRKFRESKLAIEKLKLAINAWFEPNNKEIEVRLLAKEEIAKYFYRRPLSQNQLIAKKHKNGDIELSLRATSHKEILHEVKKWMPSLIVLAPENLRQESIKVAEEFLKGQA